MENTPKLEVKINNLSTRNVIECTMQYEKMLMGIGWIAPINLARVADELTEAHNAESFQEEEDELGDVLQVLFRYCARYNFDPRNALLRSLQRNVNRTNYCLDMGGVPKDDAHMNELWQKAKESEKSNG